MIDEGLLEEVRALKEKGYTKDMVSMQGLGYKEILSYLDNEISFEEAVYILKEIRGILPNVKSPGLKENEM